MANREDAENEEYERLKNSKGRGYPTRVVENTFAKNKTVCVNGNKSYVYLIVNCFAVFCVTARHEAVQIISLNSGLLRRSSSQ